MMKPNKPTGETMDEGSDIPPMPEMGGEPDGDEIASGGEQPVPLNFLEQPDENDQMQTPEQGDIVTMMVEAKITRIEGSTAYIQPTAINGKNLSETEKEPTPETLPQEEEGENLRGMAEGMDKEAYGQAG